MHFDQPKELNLRDLSALKFPIEVTKSNLEFEGADGLGYPYSMDMFLVTQPVTPM